MGSLFQTRSDHGGRQSWDEYFLALAKQAASRSNCVRRQVGAVIVHGRRVRSTGYNGPPSGYGHCDGGACPRAMSSSAMSDPYENCFRGDTRFLTRSGTRSLEEAVGKDVQILTSRGWADATVEYFGRQPLFALTVKRYGFERVIHATGGHRWFVSDSHRKRQERTTVELTPGHYLAGARASRGGAAPSTEGIKAGLVFGDGSCNYSQSGLGSHVQLYGRARSLATLWNANEGQTFFGNMPRHWKTRRAPLDESFGYLYGWLMGYFAADGTLSKSTPLLCSANRGHLEHVIEVCYLLGIPTLGIRTEMRMGYGEPTPLHRLIFPQGTLPPEFFLLPHHREKAQERTRRRGLPCWMVVSVEPAEEDDVFCAVVPDRGEFALEGNILTGNCVAIHAEANALLFADVEDRDGATIYTTDAPCFGCAKLIANSGIGEVVAAGGRYEDWERTRRFLQDCNVRVRVLDGLEHVTPLPLRA